MQILRIDAGETAGLLPDLVAILRDSVAGGASVGFLPPLSVAEAESCWREVADALRGPDRILLIARDDAGVAGTVQLVLADRPNGRHRAEVIRLMVHSTKRRRGVGLALMRAVEPEALRAGRTTLVLNTREGDPSERLYEKLGYVVAGRIPRYARSADGTLHTTLILYKLLDPATVPAR